MAEFVQAPGFMPDPRRGRDRTRRIDHFRPYLRVEICSSLVPNDPSDKNRWYRFAAGLPLAGETWEGMSGELTYIDRSGAFQTMHGSNAIASLSGNDSLGGQGGQVSFLRTALADGLAEMMRPMDRLRIEVKHPWAPGKHRWTLFDGLVGTIQTAASGGGGYSSHLAVSASGLQTLLQNAIFNWQGFIHPASDILHGAQGKTLYEQLGHVAVPPHLAIRAVIESLLSTSMGLLVGDVDNRFGLQILDTAEQNGYVRFSEQWSSLPTVANPLPWEHIVAQSGQSFWALMQAMCEPFLHELFVGYRPWPGSEVDVPVLIHRPRPFPGKTSFNNSWGLPEVIEVGGVGQPTIMGGTDTRNGARHPNCFHWAGGGLGDASMEAFLCKVAFGWYVSESLVNRFGYAPAGVTTNVAPLVGGSNKTADGKALTDWNTFAQNLLEHYARQEAPLALLGQRTLQAPFLPVRPGQILVDRSNGPAYSDAITGYVLASSFDASVSNDACTLGMTLEVDRALHGTSAESYPERVAALIADLKKKEYAGQNIGDLGPVPAVGGSYTPPAPQAPAQRSVPSPLAGIIPRAAASQRIPGWLLAHVCQQESSMGTNLGTGGKGVCQITLAAVADLVAVGYRNPDGSLFKAKDRGDMEKNLFAAAKYLSMCRGYVFSASCPADEPALWTWVLAAYTNGPGDTKTYGASLGWTPPSSYIGAVSQRTYQTYYSPNAIKNGQANFRQMG